MVKILLDATFSGIALTESFLRERRHSENSYENHLKHFSGRFDVHLQVKQPILKFSYLILLIKYPQSTSFEIRKSLKRMSSLAYTEMD